MKRFPVSRILGKRDKSNRNVRQFIGKFSFLIFLNKMCQDDLKSSRQVSTIKAASTIGVLAKMKKVCPK